MAAPSHKRIADHFTRNQGPALPIEDFIADRRDAGDSWQTIADEIAELTDGLVAPHWSTVQRWVGRAGRPS
jgi:hypothetical protein